MSDSLDHAIEEVVAREFAGRDWVRNTRIDTRKQPQSTWTCTHTERERERELNNFSIMLKVYQHVLY